MKIYVICEDHGANKIIRGVTGILNVAVSISDMFSVHGVYFEEFTLIEDRYM